MPAQGHDYITCLAKTRTNVRMCISNYTSCQRQAQQFFTARRDMSSLTYIIIFHQMKIPSRVTQQQLIIC